MTDLRQAAETLQLEVVKLKKMLEQQQVGPVEDMLLRRAVLRSAKIVSDGRFVTKQAALEQPPLPVLEQQQAEPTCPDCKEAVLYECVACSSNNYPPKQQAEPPQRQWVGLTDEDYKGISSGDQVVAMWAERILKEKNNG